MKSLCAQPVAEFEGYGERVARLPFTGAVRDQVGRVEAADGGTLFLDEIAELPPALQAKLLHLLQEKQSNGSGTIERGAPTRRTRQ